MNSLKSGSPFMDFDPSYKMLSGSTCAESILGASMSSLELHRCNERYEFAMKGEKYDDNSFSLNLRIADYYGRARDVHFIFYLNADSALSIAAEMVVTLELWRDDVSFIAEVIDSVISQIVPCWGILTGSFGGGKSSVEDSARVYNENSGQKDCCLYETGNEGCKRGIDSKFTRLRNNYAPESDGASLQRTATSISIAIPDKDFLLADIAVEKHRRSIGQSFMSESLNDSGTSCTGSWITASSDMSLSICSVSLTEKEDELCNALKLELKAIDLQYQQRCRELLRMKESAIENAKK